MSGKDAQIIRTFLESVGIYEADALRVSIAIADGKVSADNISADDRLALNRYLNSSTDNDRLTADNAQGHRLNRAFGLLERVAEFCDKQQLVTVNRALLSIAVNAEDINRAVSSLDNVRHPYNRHRQTQETTELASNRMQKAERNLTCVHTASFFFPFSG